MSICAIKVNAITSIQALFYQSCYRPGSAPISHRVTPYALLLLYHCSRQRILSTVLLRCSVLVFRMPDHDSVMVIRCFVPSANKFVGFKVY